MQFGINNKQVVPRRNAATSPILLAKQTLTAPARVRVWQPHSSPGPSQQDVMYSMYENALELSRAEQYGQAREAFEALLEQHPKLCKAWVSYAQMERRLSRTHDPQRLAVARQILQRGLTANPDSGCLAQAWGLMELQKGNFWAAVRLLERSVMMDPVLEPVLRWKPVGNARMTVAASSRAMPAGRPAARVVCASAAPGGAAGAAAACAGGIGGVGGTGGLGPLAHDGPCTGASSSSSNGRCMSSM